MDPALSHHPQPANNKLSLYELIQELREWYRYLLSQWILIFALGLVGGITGFIYSFVKKPIYKAATKFVLEEESRSDLLGNLGGLATIAGVDIGKDEGLFQGENIIELYTSRNMITNALLSEVDSSGKKILLIEQYLAYNNVREKWKTSPQLKNIKFLPSASSRLQDSIMGIIVKDINKNNLKVFKSDQSKSTMNVEVKAENEFFAKAFNETIVQKVNDFYIQTKTKKTIEALTILQKRTDSVLKIMNGAIYSAVAIADATPNLNPTRQVQRLVPIQRSQAVAEMNKAILSELVKNLELTKMKLMKETPLIQVIDQPIYPLEREKPGKLKCILLGGVIMVFLTFIILALRRIFQKITTINAKV